jgi:hypothetical protein
MMDTSCLIMTDFPTIYTWNIDRLCGFFALARSMIRCDESKDELKWNENLLNHYRFILKI